MLAASRLATVYRDAHDKMRNIDGLQPQEAFEELLKYLLYKQASETAGARASARREPMAAGASGMDDEAVAKQIRRGFARCAKQLRGSLKGLWETETMGLSNTALLAVHDSFCGVNLAGASIDVRSAALRMFLSADLRRGLGIYLTPDEVVRAIVSVVAPSAGAAVYDPACGSGTFLAETIRHWRAREIQPGKLRVRGSDINQRMIVIAALNLAHEKQVDFRSRVLDALTPPDGLTWPKPNSIDVILTNPPFGVYVAAGAIDVRRFSTVGQRRALLRLSSEVLFLEQCLRWLRPGGMLAIIVPRGVISNKSLLEARLAIDQLAEVVAMLALPPETFAATGTCTNTCVLFLRKRPRGVPGAGVASVPVVDVTNVGFDATGRERPGGQLHQAAEDLRQSMIEGRAAGMARLVCVPRNATLSSIGRSIATRGVSPTTRRLGDVVELAQTGRTPARDAYTNEGVFALKVGNLTGQGIDWTPRDRNFVSPAFVPAGLTLREGDVVMTSSAHHPKYIAQKVDVVYSIPAFAGPSPTFVGEIMRLRVSSGAISSYELLAFLRSRSTVAAIQRLVRGQTAHLRPKDLLELPLPDRVAPPALIGLLQREAELAAELNLVVQQRRALLESL